MIFIMVCHNAFSGWGKIHTYPFVVCSRFFMILSQDATQAESPDQQNCLKLQDVGGIMRLCPRVQGTQGRDLGRVCVERELSAGRDRVGRPHRRNLGGRLGEVHPEICGPPGLCQQHQVSSITS